MITKLLSAKALPMLLVGALALASLNAEAARRLGGGLSIGKQSSNVTKRDAAPSAPSNAQTSGGTGGAAGAAGPANTAGAAAAKPATASPMSAAPAAQAAAPRRPWGAMLGGLAAGLGLAWLAHSLGLGEAFGQMILLALLAMAVLAVIGMVMRSRKAQPSGGGLAFQGAGSAPYPNPAAPRQYSPDHVGNDASARPWERSSMAFDASKYQPAAAGAGGSIIGSALLGTQSWGIPAGFDTPGFLGAARRNFVTLQDAWDRADIATLRSMMTDDMVSEIRTQLSERENHLAGQPNKTDVVMLEAQLLGIEDLGTDYMASVEFSGMIREEPSAGPSPFREVWNMTKPKDGRTGWLVAGVQALQ